MCQYNLQGDIIGMIAGHHTKVLRYEYDAWGKQLSCTGSRKDDMGVQNPFRYRHYQYDDETGLYYLNSRYYSPELGRFISADTVLGEPGRLHSHNLYAYCQNGPVNHMDQDGYDMITAIDGGGGGAGAISGAAYVPLDLSFSGGLGASWGTAKWLTYLSAPISSWLGAIFDRNVSKNSAVELPDIAGQYGDLRCVEAKNAMVDYLTKNKKHGNIIKLDFGWRPGIVYSMRYNRKISENGVHWGVEYEEIVYCNIHPYGLPKDLWIADFISANPLQNITEIPF